MTKKLRWRSGAAMGVAFTLAAASVAFDVAAPAPAEAADSVSVTPNPWYQSEPFEGWGTSLVWMANATGGYPDELREELYELVFGEEGLNLNIARYNVGGGHASDVTDYLRAGGAVEGYWAEDLEGDLYGEPTTVENRDEILGAWDPDNPEHYDFEADATQRWWVERLAEDDRISHWELFANSAPYFMTENGYVSGGEDANAEQLRLDAMDDFAGYLVTVAEFLEETYGIDVATIDPFNEPNTDYWSTWFDDDGVPTGGRQEGMHVGPERQNLMIKALAERLGQADTTTETGISVMDETHPDRFVTNWRGYDEESRASVDQLNVHTYGTGSRRVVRDIAQGADKPLWMSEVDGSWTNTFDPFAMENGLGIAERIQSDLRELEPSAWVLWQPIEDLYNMEATGEDLNWGSIFVDFDCVEGDDGVWRSERRIADADGDLDKVPECGIKQNIKFATIQNFTKFINPGDTLIATDSTETTAAMNEADDALTLVYRNPANSARSVDIDLSGFAHADGAEATTYTTTQGSDEPLENALVEAGAGSVTDDSLTIDVPPSSVTTVVIDGVGGIAEDAGAIDDGGSYLLVGEQSGKPLTAGDSPATHIEELATTADEAGQQIWTLHEAPAQERQALRSYVLETQEGKVLGATEDGTDLRELSVKEAVNNSETRWILTTEDGHRWQFVNADLAQSLEVGNQETADGSSVGTWDSSGESHQRWQIRDLASTGSEPVHLTTLAGVAPSLPEQVVPTYEWGSGQPADVVWDDVDDEVWESTGDVTVRGTATDVFGNEIDAVAEVSVGGYTTTDPVSVTVREGVALTEVQDAAPTQVPARVGASALTFSVDVEWDFTEVDGDAFEETSVVNVPGTAVSNDGEDLPATLAVIVTEAEPFNIAPTEHTSAEATFVEPGYSIDDTRNEVLDDKAWSNWKSGEKNESDTLTYTFDADYDLDSAKLYFYRDGDHTSWAEAVAFEYQTPEGDWLTVPGYESAQEIEDPTDGSAPMVEADLTDVPASTGLRAVLHAKANTHMIVSEMEIYALQAGPSDIADLATLRVNGEEVSGFDPAVFEYAVESEGKRFPLIHAVAVDSQATVEITQPTEADPTAQIAVTSADGTTTQTYEVTIDRKVGVENVEILGDVRVGETVRAHVSTDPSDAELAYEWRIDGDPVGKQDGGESLTIPEGVAGSDLELRVTASADGFAEGEGVSDPIAIVEAEEETPGEEEGSDGGDGSGGPEGPGENGDSDEDPEGGAGDASGQEADGDEENGSLPDTGSQVPWGLVGVSLLALIAGGTLYRARQTS